MFRLSDKHQMAARLHVPFPGFQLTHVWVKVRVSLQMSAKCQRTVISKQPEGGLDEALWAWATIRDLRCGDEGTQFRREMTVEWEWAWQSLTPPWSWGGSCCCGDKENHSCPCKALQTTLPLGSLITSAILWQICFTEGVLPLERKNRSKISVEDDASYKSITAIWGLKKKSLSDLHLHCCKLEPERSVYLTLPDCSMDRASRDTEIFSSEVLIQSNMPLQPFRGNVKFELVVVGRLWMLSTEKNRKRALHQEPSHAKDTL